MSIRQPEVVTVLFLKTLDGDHAAASVRLCWIGRV